MVRTFVDLIVLALSSREREKGLFLRGAKQKREKGREGGTSWIDDDYHTKSLDLARLRESLGETLYSNFLLTHNISMTSLPPSSEEGHFVFSRIIFSIE